MKSTGFIVAGMRASTASLLQHRGGFVNTSGEFTLRQTRVLVGTTVSHVLPGIELLSRDNGGNNPEEAKPQHESPKDRLPDNLTTHESPHRV